MPQSGANNLIWMTGTIADTILPWGSPNPKPRDRQLREFWPTETFLASAVATVSVRNAASDWSTDGPTKTKRFVDDMLHGINDGRGFEDLSATVSVDLYTQDNGAFIELERMQSSSDTSPVITMHHLDSARCWLTGDPMFPVLYNDIRGKWHKLKWHNVLHLREVPDPRSRYLQMCAVSRSLRIVQILKSYFTYTNEKISGRFTQAIHMVQGMTTDQIQDAVTKTQLDADAQGLSRYVIPVIVGSINPKSPLDVKTFELASLPDKFDQETWMKWYIAALALAFLTDYQELAPLPGGNLGTASQSEVLHMKTRGKGPAYFRKIMSNAINYRGVIPQSVTFLYDEQDVEEDIQHANLKLIRANARKAQVDAKYLSAEAALELAIYEGDIPEDVADLARSTRPPEPGLATVTPDGVTTPPPTPQNPPERPTEQGNDNGDKVIRRAIEGAPRGRTR